DAIATSGSAIFVGGLFTHYQGQLANRIAKIDGATCALDTTFNPATSTSNGVNNSVLALAVSGSSLYIGGSFTTYRSTTVNRVAKVDIATGALDTIFSPATNPGFDNNVEALAVGGTSVYAGGTFSRYRNVTGSATRLAKLDLTTGVQDTTFSP